MKTVTAQKLALAYSSLYPEELVSQNNTKEQCLVQLRDILGNWLFRYEKLPETAIAGSNWQGRVTKALFVALDIKQPKTVKKMLEVLQ